MAVPGPGDESQNPFGGMPIFGDLARLLSSQGPVNWEVARQMARWLSTSGQPEANVDPLVRVRFEELYGIAEMHVVEATGLTPRDTAVRVLTRSEWASETLTDWQPLMEKLAASLSPGGGDSGGVEAPTTPEQMMEGLAQSLSPLLLGLQSGSMVGHLALQSLGTYDLPVPRRRPALIVVAANVDSFAEEWSLPVDDARLFLAVAELAHHAVLSLPHVRARFSDLVGEYVAGFRPNPSAIEEKLGDVDPSDMDALQSALGDPESLLGAMATPQQAVVAEQLAAAVAALVGYVEYVTATVATRLVGNPSLLAEALRRRRVSRGQGERFVERIFGLEMSQSQLERGGNFVQGVVEREGPEALSRIWAKPGSIPTPAEIGAPGLWLERISYDNHDDDEPGGEAGSGGV